MWKNIPEYENLYMISDTGKIKRISTRYGNPSRRILKQTLDIHNYLYVTLSKNGICKKHKVHKLVLVSFTGPRPPEMVARHLDGNKHNNKLNNLLWGTRVENEKDKIKHGRFNHGISLGSKHGKSKLTEEDVIKIKHMLKNNENQHTIAKMFNVHHTTISCIKRNIIWRHISV